MVTKGTVTRKGYEDMNEKPMMKMALIMLLAFGALFLVMRFRAHAKENHARLQVGDPAPRFSLPAHDGKTIALNDFLGKKVVLYFYPKDETPGCTREACSFRDHNREIQAL